MRQEKHYIIYNSPRDMMSLNYWHSFVNGLIPHNGSVDEDDLWDWENNPCIDHLNDLMKMLSSWSPQPADSIMHKDKISITARLTHVALLRAQNMHKEALDISLRLVREKPAYGPSKNCCSALFG